MRFYDPGITNSIDGEVEKIVLIQIMSIKIIKRKYIFTREYNYSLLYFFVVLNISTIYFFITMLGDVL
ncbi:MAG: hypothetical protein BZ136_05580 [Methanosphaera sp. rholeuAM74]|nr:MAG: hypothetical protein BZ136_05580 [Methanosphaera sp. rholeuAM74]